MRRHVCLFPSLLMRHCRPQSVSAMGNCLFQLASTLIFIAVIQPIFLAGAVPLMAVYYFIQKVTHYCASMARAWKKIASGMTTDLSQITSYL